MRPISIGANLVASTTTTVYTVPAGYYAKWNLMYLHNTTGTQRQITAVWYDSSENEEYDILRNYDMNSKDYLKFDGGAFVVLEENDEIRLTPEASSDFSVINTFELIRK